MNEESKKNICSECGETATLTIEHLVPLWFSRRLYMFGISHSDVCRESGFTVTELTTKVCSKCNYMKGGIILYNNPIVKRYLQGFIYLVENKISRIGKRKLIAICKCKECEQVQKWQERQEKTQIMTAVKDIHAGLSPRESYQLNHA